MNHRLNLAGLTGALLIAAPAFAEVELSEHFSLSGYVVGAYTETDYKPGGSESTFLDSGANTLDSAKVALTGVNGPWSGTVSALWIPAFTGASDEFGVLDAFASYTSGPVTLTGGKFLSYMGFEAFDAVNMTQLTYALISGIPAYHSGVKLDYSTDAFGTGLAVVDSVNPGSGFFKGDNDFSDDLGLEAYYSYKATKGLTIFAGIAYEDTDGAANDLVLYDLWASYAVTDQLTVAAEYTINKDVAKSWLAFAQYSFTPKFSVIGRISSIDYDAGGDAFKWTVAPTYVINENLSIRAEYSQLNDMVIDSDFVGVQAVFKF